MAEPELKTQGERAAGATLEPAGSASAVPVSRFRRYELCFVLAAAAAILLPGLWSYTLIDPWETHYGEVARRMLQDSDWIQLKWQNEDFDSKPVLTFWLMAAGMEGLGVADGGGYSGELTATARTLVAIRLPFVLFGIFGLAVSWWMLARLVNRRVAWLSFAVITTCPLYFFIARQGITDMPMVACLMGSVACIAMVVAQRDGPLQRWRGRFDAHHVFLAFIAIACGGQLLAMALHLLRDPSLAPGLRIPSPALTVVGPFAAGLLTFLIASLWWKPARRRQTVYVGWLFALMGVSILGKGPPAAAIVVFIALFYIVLARRWDLLRSAGLWWDILRGTIVMLLIALPWHVAIFLKQGLRWVNVYLRTHIMQRAFAGVHGDRGTFDYYVQQLGIGMWPWVVLVPGALATVLTARLARTSESSVRLLVGTWAVVGFALFAAVQTKFHHYVLPVVPALAILVAFYLDDLLDGRIRRASVYLVMAAGLVLLICRDLVFEPKQLIELFIYRHDRPWPEAVDVGGALVGFGVAFAAFLLVLMARRARKAALLALAGVGVVFALWCGTAYMQAAAPHWGQLALHQTYYAQRQIHGIDIEYYSLRDLADEWQGRQQLVVRSVLPEGFLADGRPMKVTIRVPGAGIPGDRLVLEGSLAAVGDDRFTIAVPASETAKLAGLIERGQSARPSRRAPRRQVDADRLFAWQLNWRGENFWSGGEIWGPFAETQTVFMKTDNKEFLDYLDKLGVPGRRYFLITEAARAQGLKAILPTPQAKQSFELLDTSNNKFTLLSFTL